MSEGQTNRGRPPALTDEIHQQIVNSVAGGVGLKRAGELALVTGTSVMNWMKRGKLDEQEGRDTIWAAFFRDVTQARARAVALCEGTVLHAAVRKRDWKAAVTYLERQVPKEWGRKDQVRIEIDGALQELLEKVEPLMPPKHFQSLLTALAQVHRVPIEVEPAEPAALPAG